MSDIDSLRSQKWSAEQQYGACQERIRDCEKKLESLKPAKERIAAAKDAFRDIRRQEKRELNESTDWKGSTKQDFKNRISDILDENDLYYSDTLDTALDSINDEITRLENKVMEEYGLLGRLGSWINSLANEIENFFN